MIDYPILTNPDDVNFNQNTITKRELKNNFEWFVERKSERLKILCQVVLGLEVIILDEIYLSTLEKFLRKNIQIRYLSEKEINTKRENLPVSIRAFHKIPNYELLEPYSTTLTFDVGVYFAELLNHNIGGFYWEIESKKNMHAYGRPILSKKGYKNSLDFWNIMNIFVNKIVKGTTGDGGLLNLYKVWEEQFM